MSEPLNEPTDEMLEAAMTERDWQHPANAKRFYRRVWKAMHQASHLGLEETFFKAYACPAGCGCLWRDNGDETMSLYGPNSKSCDVCEFLGLEDLIPVSTHAKPVDLPSADSAELVPELLAELDRAMTKFPTWPTDPLHALGVVNEEVGELSKAVLQAVYEPEKNPLAAVKSEAVQAAAMCLRFMASLDRYVYAKCDQHTQPSLSAQKLGVNNE